MDLIAAKEVIVRTHRAALALGTRAIAIEMISGPGVGKSDSMRQSCATLAREINEPVGLHVFMMATITSADVRGFMLPQKGANGALDTIFSTPPWYPTLANIDVFEPDGTHHEPGTWVGAMPRVGLLGLDEWAQAEDEVKKPAADLLLKGCVGTVHMPPGWRVLAASNRITDRAGALRSMTFIVNRRLEVRIDPNLPAWLTWANTRLDRERPHYLTMSFAQKNPDIVFADKVPDGSDPFCTPRSLCMLDAALRALRSDEDIAKDRLPTDPIAREVAAGLIGGGSAAQYFTHLKYADELPDMADIEHNPMDAKLPPNKDAQMVAGYMLAHNITEINAQNVMKYIGRLSVEMQVLSVGAARSRPATALHLINTPEFTQWLKKHKDLLVASRS